MPELPEVETVRNVLKRDILNVKIIDIDIFYNKMILNDINYFKSNLINKEFKDILRIGKVLIFKLDDIYLISHLRMEGKYFIKDKSIEKEKHEHIIFHLSNGMTLRYHDTRKFGIMVLKKECELYTTPPIINIGKEPFTINYIDLYNTLIKKNIPIKSALLDQSIMSGLGNIYVDEVLFLSKINPNRTTKFITLDDTLNIVNNSILVLNKAIEYKGTTIRSYTSSLGVKGGYQDFLVCHTLKKCKVCNNLIIKDKINGRGTYYCPICQKM